MNKTQIDEAILKFQIRLKLCSIGAVHLSSQTRNSRVYCSQNGDWLGLWRRTKTIYLRCVDAGAIILSPRWEWRKAIDVVRKDLTLEGVRQLITKFEERFKSSQCIDIIGIDISTAEGRKKALDAGVISRHLSLLHRRSMHTTRRRTLTRNNLPATQADETSRRRFGRPCYLHGTCWHVRRFC